MTVYGFSGQAPVGGLTVPTKTMFHEPPFQVPHSAFRENHCCCEPESIWPSILQSARKPPLDRKSTRLNSSHANISYAVFCLKKKKIVNLQAAKNPDTV